MAPGVYEEGRFPTVIHSIGTAAHVYAIPPGEYGDLVKVILPII